MTDNPDQTVKDPVCGMTKPKSQMKAEVIYEGETYYFCSETDKDMFLAHPEHWVPRDKEFDTEGNNK